MKTFTGDVLMKNVSHFTNYPLKAKGGTNSVNRKRSAEVVRVEGAKCRRECEFSGPRATLCGDRAGRAREMQARVRFVHCAARNPLRRSCASSARYAGEYDLSGARATLCAGRAREMQTRVRFVRCARNPLRRSRALNAGKRAHLGSWKMRTGDGLVELEYGECVGGLQDENWGLGRTT